MNPDAPLHIVVRADGNNRIGYGHLVRTRTVLRALEKKVYVEARYLMLPDSDREVLTEAGCRVEEIKDPAAATWLDRIDHAREVLLLDSYTIREDDLRAVREAGIRTLLFDDGCRLTDYAGMMIVDSAPGADALPYHGAAKRLLGPDYYPLRAEFREASAEKNHPERAGKLLLVMGGSDPDDVSVRLLPIVVATGLFRHIDVVLGPGYRGELSEEAGDSVLHIHRDPPRFVELLAGSDLAVSAAGGTALELAALGVPSLLVSLTADQRPIADNLHKAGAAEWLGDAESLQSEQLTETLTTLAGDRSARRAMSDAGRRLIDGNGAARIAEALVELDSSPAANQPAHGEATHA